MTAPVAADLRRKLNPQQLDAVATTEGPVMVFAGAGSGKTRVITYRAAHLVAGLGVPPWQVMCVTFTNKAAGEMRERLAGLLGESVGRDVWVSTFHATGARLLRRYHDRLGLSKDFAIYDDADQRSLMNRVYDDLQWSESDLAPRSALWALDRLKQDAVSATEYEARAQTENERRIAQVYVQYEKRLQAANAVDFGDLLKKLVELIEKHPDVRDELQRRFRYLMVDEFQDTNGAQFRIVRGLVGPSRNLCVVGDDDQAIYAWRGADARNLANFRTEFPDAKNIKLEENYRSTGMILRAANAVIQKLEAREPKVLFTHNEMGPKVELMQLRDEREEALHVALRIRAAHGRGAKLADHAIFYRIHAQSRAFEEAMRAYNLPYRVVGGVRFFERAEVKDILAYLRLATNPDDDVSLLRVINQPTRGLGKTTLDRLAAFARLRGGSLWSVLAARDFPPDIQAAARKRLTEFATLVQDLRDEGARHADRPGDLASLVLERTGYQAMLDADTTPEADARKENLRELIGSMAQYTAEENEPSLTGYLERVTLDDGGERGGNADAVTLMTVHGAKGLEFDTVFVTGLEEKMFPYKGVELGAEDGELDEERRLAYVAFTRARKQLVLSRVDFRQLFGRTRAEPPSRFLTEIPNDVLSQPVRRTPPGFVGGSPPAWQMPGGGGAAGRTDSQRSTTSSSAGSDTRRVVYDEPMETPHESLGHQFRKGMRVIHPKFGMGNVRGVEPGAELKLTVYFPGIGAEKKVLAEFIRPV